MTFRLGSKLIDYKFKDIKIDVYSKTNDNLEYISNYIGSHLPSLIERC